MPKALPQQPADADAAQREDAANDDEGNTCLWPVRHVLIAASKAKPPFTRGLPSVFALGELGTRPAANTNWPVAGGPGARAAGPDRRFTAAAHYSGGTRCTGGQYPSDRWTPERAEKERARRAKQRPPKPTRGAKSKSTKLRRFIEINGDDWDA